MTNLDKNVVAAHHMLRWLDDKLYPGNDTFIVGQMLVVLRLSYNNSPFELETMFEDHG